MNGNYISKDSLPGDLLRNIETVTMNAGSNFLAGAATNAFSKALSTTDDAKLLLSTLSDTAMIKKISKELAEHCTTVAAAEIASYVSDKTTELLSFSKMENVLLGSVSYWTRAGTMKPAEVLEMLKTKDTSAENQKETARQQSEKLNEVREKISAEVGTMKEYAHSTLSSLDAGIASIAAYMTMGPDWVVTKVNSYVGQAVEKVESFIGTQTESLARSRDAAIDALGRGVGAMNAAVINRMAMNEAKKTKSDAEALVSKTRTKALNAITKALMKVRQLTGIAVPIAYPELPKLTSLL